MVVVTNLRNLQIVRLFLIAIFLRILIVFASFCIESTSACRSQEEIRDMKNNKYFSNGTTWGGWVPPYGNDSWKFWVAFWGTENSSNFDSTEEGRGPETGWPTYWKGLGKGNAGVPPPPWAYVPLGYGKPEFCFLQPAKGDCEFNLTRWGFNPAQNECQLFEYSGCGGNENNFTDKESCKTACVDVPSTDCESKSKTKFEKMIFD